jgi:non-haem Fe2+, alpha-ketoglutarate-dependent halogenase
MPKRLTDAQIEHYRDNGYVFPFRALSRAEAAEARRELEGFEARAGNEAQKLLGVKSHLPFRFIADIVRHPRILDAVEDLLGPNLLCWGSSFFQKNAHDPRFISWHQDSFYYGMDPSNTCTAWLAFSTSDELSGSVRVVPGSHLKQMEFVNTPHENNLLTRGQTILGVDEAKAVHMNLEPGEFSLHHEGIVHNSEPNRSDDRRIGLSIHYIPTSTKQIKYRVEGKKPFATLVRGVDEFGYWEQEPAPERDFDPAMLEKVAQIRRDFLARTR